MLSKLEEFLKGKKTYLVMAAGVIVNGMFAMGIIPMDYLEISNTVLGFLGLGSIRAGIAKNGANK